MTTPRPGSGQRTTGTGHRAEVAERQDVYYTIGAGEAQREMTPANSVVGSRPSSSLQYALRGLQQQYGQVSSEMHDFCRRCALAQDLGMKKGPLTLKRHKQILTQMRASPASSKVSGQTGNRSWYRPPRLLAPQPVPATLRGQELSPAVGVPATPSEGWGDARTPTPQGVLALRPRTPAQRRPASANAAPGRRRDYAVNYEADPERPERVMPRDYVWTSPAGTEHIEFYASHKIPPFG